MQRGGILSMLRMVLVAFAASVLVHSTAGAQDEQATPATGDAAKAGEEESLEVGLVRFRGNRRVEDDAIRVNLRTVAGANLTPDLLREDVRAIWAMGFFDDVQVETNKGPKGQIVTFVMKEKPAIRKIYVSGHEEIGLTKINEILDIKREQILDLSKVKKNAEKIRDLYVERGYYMAEVSHEIKRQGTAQVDVYFRIRENTKVEVRRINFVGNKGASDLDLRAVMLTKEGDMFSLLTSSGTYRQDAFQRDLLLIQSWYWDRGYVDIKVGEPLMELSQDKLALFITIPIEEGKRYKLGKVNVVGELLEPKEAYLARLSVKTGQQFNRSQLTADMQVLTDAFKDQGYAYVNVTPLTDKDEASLIIHLTFDVQRGEKVYVERINVRGNSKTRDKVIRREMRIVEGEEFSQNALDTSKRRVTALGFFERADMSTTRGSGDDKMLVNVEVAERQTGAFQIGAGFSSVENFIAQAQISQNNLFGRGTLLTFQAQLSSIRQLLMLQYQDSYFLDTRWTFGFNLFNQQRYFFSFFRESKGGSLTWGYLIHDDVRLLLTYTLEQVGVRTSGRGALFNTGLRDQIPSGSLANLLRSGLTSSWRITMHHDTRDNRLFATRGWYNTASAEFAQPYFFSENRFTRYELATRFFYPIWGPIILRTKLEGGMIVSPDPQGVPITERYFVGGIFDIRGYAPRSLGPRIRAPGSQTPDSQLVNSRVGGNLQLIGNLELEFPIIAKVGIKGVIFTDVGNAFNTESQYCALKPPGGHASTDPCNILFPLGSLRASWGFGFRWFSPIGPLRFEWGIPFYRISESERPVVFEFTIGNFF